MVFNSTFTTILFYSLLADSNTDSLKHNKVENQKLLNINSSPSTSSSSSTVKKSYASIACSNSIQNKQSQEDSGADNSTTTTPASQSFSVASSKPTASQYNATHNHLKRNYSNPNQLSQSGSATTTTTTTPASSLTTHPARTFLNTNLIRKQQATHHQNHKPSSTITPK